MPLPVPAEAAETLLAAHGFSTDAARRFFEGAADPQAWAALAGLEHARSSADPSALALTTAPNRHQWIVTLAQAYAAGGDERDAAACLTAIEEWIADPRANSATATPSDAGFRLISWCWALVLVRQSPQLSALRLATMADAIRGQATHLAASALLSSAPATTVIVNALALFYVALLFPECAESRAWRDLATRVLVAECERQVHSDGVHFEQATCFQHYTADVYLHFLILAARNRLAVPQLVTERLQRMLEFILAIRMPDGTVPSIGDSDGGCLLPLASRCATDARGRFALGAVLFHRADFAWAAGGPAPEVAWLMGTTGLRALAALTPVPPAAAPSRAFPSGGYVVMRSGWDRNAHQMVVDVGAIGCPVSGAHGHADLLSVQCAVFGDPVLVDPGTHCYGDSRWRDFFRSTAAHSTIVVDGESQAEPAGSFGWRRRPRVRLREWHSTAELDFLDAEHDGYLSLPNPVRHRRRVIFVKPLAQGEPSYWILVDDLNGSARHDVELRFQFAAGTVTLGPHPWARATAARGQCLWISPFPSAPAQPALKCGEPSPICGWISPEFTRLSPAPMLIYSFAVALPWRIVTLLLPEKQGLATPPGVRPIYDAGGLPHGFVFERPRRLVRFDDRAVLVERD